MPSPVEALLAAYPDRLTLPMAQEWLTARRDLLLERVRLPDAAGSAASSGCAATGAWAHARELAQDAAHALARLDAGVGTECERCSRTLSFDRLDAAPAAVRCRGCARTYAVDTRWCR